MTSPLPHKPPPGPVAFVALCRSAGAYDLAKAVRVRDNPVVLSGFENAHYLFWLLGVLNYGMAALVESMSGAETAA